MTWRIPLSNKEYEALKMSGTDGLWTLDKNPDDWRKYVVFTSFQDMVTVHGKVRSAAPNHAHRCRPYLSLCRKIAVINLGNRVGLMGDDMEELFICEACLDSFPAEDMEGDYCGWCAERMLSREERAERDRWDEVDRLHGEEW